jgi:hypothetical protein
MVIRVIATANSVLPASAPQSSGTIRPMNSGMKIMKTAVIASSRGRKTARTSSPPRPRALARRTFP